MSVCVTDDEGDSAEQITALKQQAEKVLERLPPLQDPQREPL
jgi:hypothetical protein